MDGLTPLMLAARTGKSDIMAELLEAGADLELKDNKGGLPVGACLCPL